MILYNLTFGFIINLLLLLYSILQNKIYWVSFLLISIFYYILDSCVEVFYYKRYIYTLHHIIMIFICSYLYSNNNYNTKDIAISFLLIESTTMIINIREILKEKNKLPLFIDFLFLIYYVFIRCIISPYLLNKILKYNFKNNIILPIACHIILLMSFIWSIIWTRNLYFKYKKNIN